jgi:hypothetical protein
MRCRWFARAVLALMPLLAWVRLPVWGETAHPPSESVTVTGTRSREVLQKFVGSLAARTRLSVLGLRQGRPR